MNEDLVTVYTAQSLMEAQLLVDRLADAGVEAFVDNTDSPLDGLTAAYQTQRVQVLPRDEEQARAVAATFESEKSNTTDGDTDEVSGLDT